MVYDVNTRQLRTNRGILLKTLHCPLHKNWSELTPIQSVTPQRHCESCGKFVLDLSQWSDEEAASFLGQAPEHCVYADPTSPNITISGYQHDSLPKDPCPFRRIATARGEDAINQAVKDGFWPLVKRVEPSPKIRSWMEVYQHRETGEIQLCRSYRWKPSTPWQRVIEPFDFYPYPIKHHIAAYLLPKDLKKGERVFLTDLIEDLIGVWGNQGNTSRLEAAYAVWNGKEFKIEWNENKDAVHYIG